MPITSVEEDVIKYIEMLEKSSDDKEEKPKEDKPEKKKENEVTEEKPKEEKPKEEPEKVVEKIVEKPKIVFIKSKEDVEKGKKKKRSKAKKKKKEEPKPEVKEEPVKIVPEKPKAEKKDEKGRWSLLTKVGVVLVVLGVVYMLWKFLRNRNTGKVGAPETPVENTVEEPEPEPVPVERKTITAWDLPI